MIEPTLLKIMGHKPRSSKGFGVEIELEATNKLPPYEFLEGTNWKKVSDGSLRGNAAEFVLLNPRKSFSALGKDVDELNSVIKKYSTKLLDSVRAGTHIHYDVSELNFKEFMTFLCLWISVEELLSTQFGEGRVGNHFCLRAIDAEYMINVYSNWARKGRFDSFVTSDDLRYSALNLTSLPKYCTIEFRALRGTTDKTTILRWAGILDSLVKGSRLFPDPKHVVNNLSMDGGEEFFRRLLGDELTKQFFKDRELADEYLINGVRMAQEIAYARKEW